MELATARKAGRKHVMTYSSMGAWRACPRKWLWGTYLGLRKRDEEVAGPLPFGSRVHKALEMWSRDEVAEPVQAWDGLMLPAYEYAAERGWDTKQLDKENKEGFAMLQNLPDWMASSGFFAEYTVEQVEHVMKDVLPIVLADGTEVDIQLWGKADLIIRRKSDGMHRPLDWKTSQAVAESVLSVFAKSPQPRIYKHLAAQEHPELTFAGATFLVLRKTQQSTESKIPYYATLDVEINAADEAAYMQRLRGIAAQIVVAEQLLDSGADPELVAPFEPSRINCMSCPFRQPCDMMNNYPAGARDMLEERYVAGNPLARYGVRDEEME